MDKSGKLLVFGSLHITLVVVLPIADLHILLIYEGNRHGTIIKSIFVRGTEQ